MVCSNLVLYGGVWTTPGAVRFTSKEIPTLFSFYMFLGGCQKRCGRLGKEKYPCLGRESNPYSLVVQSIAQLVHCKNNTRTFLCIYRGDDKCLARPTSRCILFDGENISFDASLVIYINSTTSNIPPIMVINRIYETQNLLSL